MAKKKREPEQRPGLLKRFGNYLDRLADEQAGPHEGAGLQDRLEHAAPFEQRDVEQPLTVDPRRPSSTEHLRPERTCQLVGLAGDHRRSS